MSATDPLVELCKLAGCQTEYSINLDGTENPDIVVVYFPCKATGKSVLQKDLDVIQQLDYVKFFNSNWVDQSTSVTGYYDENSLPKIKEYVKDNWGNFKALSFLRASNHGFLQAPYIEITKEQYEEAMKGYDPSVFTKGLKDSSGIEALPDSFECSDGHCPIK